MKSSLILHPTRAKKPSEKITKTVRFEDHGQDFLEWDIEDGKVTGCRPFQGSIWCGCTVLNSSIRKDTFLRIATKSGGLGITLRYPLDRVMKLKPAAKS